MKKFLRNIGILILPFALMISVNEIIKYQKPALNSNHFLKGIKTINSKKNLKDTCTWACYYQTTNVCKKKHVKYLTKYYKFTDGIYFGIINGLKNTGHYQLANIIVLVILLPLLIWVFIIKSLNVQDQINKLKN